LSRTAQCHEPFAGGETMNPTEFAPKFQVLSTSQLEKLIEATLLCLDRTGMNISNEEGRRLLAAAGARVDGVRVRIPRKIIEEVLATTPPTWTLWSRPTDQGPGEPRIELAPYRVYFGPGPTCTYTLDPESGERRKTRRCDPGVTARVCDALPNVDYVMSLGLIDDVTPSLAPVYEFAEMVSNTAKPVLPWAYSSSEVKDIYQMAVTIAGSEEALAREPFLAFFSTFQSPLILTDEDTANVLWAAEHNLPIVLIGGGAAGMTAPVTGAGLLVTYLAGALAGLAVIQLKRPGTRVCLGGVPEAMDLRTGRCAYGAPEMSLYSAAMADLSRAIKVPFMGTAGASEAKVLDQQAAIESTVQVVLSGLSGASMVHDVGFLDCADLGSLEMLVMNDEIISMTWRILRGMEVSDDTLMLDLIDQVGPGGEYMSTKETARRCRTEIWNPTLMDRNPYVIWEAAGSLTMHDRIRAKLQRIIQEHRPPGLPAGASAELERILEAAEAREKGRR
jgi:trimethylamine--corrinoid protein Co-methyltransferase